MSKIEENTVDVIVNVYPTARDFDYRHQVRPNPDAEDIVDIIYQEKVDSEYENKETISFSREDWQKLKHAVEVCFDNTI